MVGFSNLEILSTELKITFVKLRKQGSDACRDNLEITCYYNKKNFLI